MILPIDELKIDRSFIRGIGTSANDGALASVVVNLARSLQIAVTAEGVETVNELEFLRSRGCDNIQGYLYSPAVSAGAVEALLTEGHVRQVA